MFFLPIFSKFCWNLPNFTKFSNNKNTSFFLSPSARHSNGPPNQVDSEGPLLGSLEVPDARHGAMVQLHGTYLEIFFMEIYGFVWK